MPDTFLEAIVKENPTKNKFVLPKRLSHYYFSYFPCGQIFKLVQINSRTLSIDHSLTEKISHISIDQYIDTLEYVLEVLYIEQVMRQSFLSYGIR